jgi:hypothetical protein
MAAAERGLGSRPAAGHTPRRPRRSRWSRHPGPGRGRLPRWRAILEGFAPGERPRCRSGSRAGTPGRPGTRLGRSGTWLGRSGTWLSAASAACQPARPPDPVTDVVA